MGLRVCIANCPPDHNKGASAIAWGMIRRLQMSGAVDHISALSTRTRFRSAVDYRFLTARFPEVEVLPGAVLPNDELASREGSLGRMVPAGIRQSVALAGAGMRSLIAPQWTLDERFHPIANSNLVINRGGPFFEALGPPPNPSFLAKCFPFVVARRLGTPYAMVGETIGMLSSSWSRRVLRDLFEHAELVGLREDLSLEVLERAGIHANARVMLDNAFWVDPRRSERVNEILARSGATEGRYLAVTCRPWRENEIPYVDALAHCIDRLVPGDFDHVLLVCNMIHPGAPSLDDRPITRSVMERLSTSKRHATLVEDDLAPDELASLYGSAAVLLGTRLHSLILALAGGGRVAGISYWGAKTTGVLRMLGLEEFVADIDELDAESLAGMTRSARKQTDTASRIRILRDAGDSVLDELLSSLER